MSAYVPSMLGLAGSSLLSGTYPAPIPVRTPTWPFVRRRFLGLLASLDLTDWQHEDGLTKARGVVACLNRTYRGHSDLALNGRLVGSWGKATRVRPPRDLDLLYELPPAVLDRFMARAGNGPSQLLQEVRAVLSASYPQTAMRGDGQVVVVPFNTCPVEVVPAFRLPSGYLVCDTNDGGKWKQFDPQGEEDALTSSDAAWHGCARKLIRALKQWRRHCNVPIKSIHLEAIVREALPSVAYTFNDEYWFDWLVRDCLARLVSKAGAFFALPGT